jgi:hypothetical protein
VGPDVGKLACGYEAIGHLAEPEEILRAVKQLAPVVGTPAERPSPAPARRKAKPRKKR